MKKTGGLKKIIGSTLLAFALASTTAIHAEEYEESGEWKNSVYIYGWLPSFSGSMKFDIPGGGAGGGDQTGESDFLDSLDAVFMASYVLQKDKWSFMADYLYLSASGSDAGTVTIPILNQPTVNVASSQELTTWLLSMYGGYKVVDTGNITLGAIGGIRYLSLGVDLAFALNDRHIALSPSVELLDFVIGAQGQYDINENWYMPYLFDIGGGDSTLTYQAMAGAGYRFGWGDIIATYRYLHYEEEGLVQDFDLYGPKLGVVFHF
ncbi:MAG: hypothetical protein U9R26_09330 [Campylobacterota bacterium]|nr:hypothetical protein [Campylobacterota bacterium]